MAKTLKKVHIGQNQALDVWNRFRRNKGAFIGCIVIVIIGLIALFSGIFIDYDILVIGQNVAERLQGPSV